MNEFYSISSANCPVDNVNQLTYAGTHRTLSYGFAKKDGYGGTKYISHDVDQPVTSEYYDDVFAHRIVSYRPPYELDNFLNFHLTYYTKKGGNKEKFLKHIQYIILPLIKKRKDIDVYIDLVDCWIKTHDMSKNTDQNLNTNVYGSNNIINVASGNIHQSNTSITLSQSDYSELKNLGAEEDQINELRAIIEENKSNKPALISKALKWIGDVAKTLVVKGLADNIPQITAFVDGLIRDN